MSTHARERLRQWRTERGLSTTDVGRMLGCSQSYVSKVEHGHRQPGTAFALAVEVATAGWRGGPIHVAEWVMQAADRRRGSASAGTGA